jgi:hypothetical protein
MRSEAIGELRTWTKQRLGEQEQLLRTLERSVKRLDEIELEREAALAEIRFAVEGLDSLGLAAEQLTEFVGTDVVALCNSKNRGRRRAATTSRPAARSDADTTGGAS